MLIKPYDKISEKRHILSLLAKRHLHENLANDLPEFGLVATKHDIPVAAGFLRKIEGGYAMLDSYITNPDFGSSDRHRALDIITDKLIKISRHNSVTKLIAFTQDREIYVRSLNHDFTDIPHFFTIRSL